MHSCSIFTALLFLAFSQAHAQLLQEMVSKEKDKAKMAYEQRGAPTGGLGATFSAGGNSTPRLVAYAGMNGKWTAEVRLSNVVRQVDVRHGAQIEQWTIVDFDSKGITVKNVKSAERISLALEELNNPLDTQPSAIAGGAAASGQIPAALLPPSRK